MAAVFCSSCGKKSNDSSGSSSSYLFCTYCQKYISHNSKMRYQCEICGTERQDNNYYFHRWCLVCRSMTKSIKKFVYCPNCNHEDELNFDISHKRTCSSCKEYVIFLDKKDSEALKEKKKDMFFCEHCGIGWNHLYNTIPNSVTRKCDACGRTSNFSGKIKKNERVLNCSTCGRPKKTHKNVKGIHARCPDCKYTNYFTYSKTCKTQTPESTAIIQTKLFCQECGKENNYYSVSDTNNSWCSDCKSQTFHHKEKPNLEPNYEELIEKYHMIWPLTKPVIPENEENILVDIN